MTAWQKKDTGKNYKWTKCSFYFTSSIRSWKWIYWKKSRRDRERKKGVVSHDSLIIKSMYITTEQADLRHLSRVNTLLPKHLGDDGTSSRGWDCQFRHWEIREGESRRTLEWLRKAMWYVGLETFWNRIKMSFIAHKERK